MQLELEWNLLIAAIISGMRACRTERQHWAKAIVLLSVGYWEYAQQISCCTRHSQETDNWLSAAITKQCCHYVAFTATSQSFSLIFMPSVHIFWTFLIGSPGRLSFVTLADTVQIIQLVKHEAQLIIELLLQFLVGAVGMLTASCPSPFKQPSNAIKSGARRWG